MTKAEEVKDKVAPKVKDASADFVTMGRLFGEVLAEIDTLRADLAATGILERTNSESRGKSESEVHASLQRASVPRPQFPSETDVGYAKRVAAFKKNAK